MGSEMCIRDRRKTTAQIQCGSRRSVHQLEGTQIGRLRHSCSITAGHSAMASSRQQPGDMTFQIRAIPSSLTDNLQEWGGGQQAVGRNDRQHRGSGPHRRPQGESPEPIPDRGTSARSAAVNNNGNPRWSASGPHTLTLGSRRGIGMEVLWTAHRQQGSGMGQGQARQATALQPLHQEKTMEQPATNSRAHGTARQQRVHRHPTPFTDSDFTSTPPPRHHRHCRRRGDRGLQCYPAIRPSG